MSTVDRTAEYYDDFSRTYDRGRDRGYHRLVDDLQFRVLEPYLAGARVLDAGCGTGLLLERIAQRSACAVGLDLSAGMAQIALKRRLPVVRGTLTALPFAAESFDLVCSFKVLAHVREREQALAELLRVTRRGGHLVLEFYNRNSLRYWARRGVGPRPIGRHHRESDLLTRWDTLSGLRRDLPPELELVGFHGVRVFTPWAKVFARPGSARFFAFLERHSTKSVFGRWGGFLVLVLRRRFG